MSVPNVSSVFAVSFGTTVLTSSSNLTSQYINPNTFVIPKELTNTGYEFVDGKNLLKIGCLLPSEGNSGVVNSHIYSQLTEKLTEFYADHAHQIEFAIPIVNEHTIPELDTVILSMYEINKETVITMTTYDEYPNINFVKIQLNHKPVETFDIVNLRRPLWFLNGTHEAIAVNIQRQTSKALSDYTDFESSTDNILRISIPWNNQDTNKGILIFHNNIFSKKNMRILKDINGICHFDVFVNFRKISETV